MLQKDELITIIEQYFSDAELEIDTEKLQNKIINTLWTIREDSELLPEDLYELMIDVVPKKQQSDEELISLLEELSVVLVDYFDGEIDEPEEEDE